MGIEIREFRSSDIDIICVIQKAAFKPLYEKYHDEQTNPYRESKEAVLRKYEREGTRGYLILQEGIPVGACRINIDPETRSGRISGLCVLPQFQGQGIARAFLTRIEQMYSGINRWFLDTVKQEAGCCHLYEKLGYVRTGAERRINDKMTLVYYEKNLPGSCQG